MPKVEAATAERDRLVEARARFGDESNRLGGGLADTVREVFEDARRSLAAVTTDSQFNQFVRDFVGPMVMLPEGPVKPRDDDAATASSTGQYDWAN